MESYKLGNLFAPLASRLGSPPSSGDAMATVKLFEVLLEKDISKQILKSQIKELNNNQFPQNIFQ